MNSPFISVIIPTYNRAHILERSIKSILAQTFDDFELIIVDDGSTDNTRNVVESMCDIRIRYFYQENRGVSAARNAGAELAQGAYITFLDSDDEVIPGWLESYVTALADAKTGIVCSGCLYTATGETILPTAMGPMFDYQTGLFLAGTFAVRRELFQLVNGYVETLRHGENTELGIRLVRACKANGYTVFALRESLLIYHKSSGQNDPPTDFRFAERLATAEYMLQAHGDMLHNVPRELIRYYEIAGVNAARIGKRQTARHYFLRAIRQYPLRLENYARIAISLFPPLVRRIWVQPH